MRLEETIKTGFRDYKFVLVIEEEFKSWIDIDDEIVIYVNDEVVYSHKLSELLYEEESKETYYVSEDGIYNDDTEIDLRDLVKRAVRWSYNKIIEELKEVIKSEDLDNLKEDEKINGVLEVYNTSIELYYTIWKEDGKYVAKIGNYDMDLYDNNIIMSDIENKEELFSSLDLEIMNIFEENYYL